MDDREKTIAVDLILREKPAKIIVGLRTMKDSVYVTLLAKEANCTYSHTVKILNILRDLDMVKFEKKGRIKRVTLTEDGLDIAQKLEAVMKKLLQLDSSMKKTRKKK